MKVLMKFYIRDYFSAGGAVESGGEGGAVE